MAALLIVGYVDLMVGGQVSLSRSTSSSPPAEKATAGQDQAWKKPALSWTAA